MFKKTYGLMRLLFYNNWHNGDIHFTREFIKDIINKTKFDEYYYLHNNSHKLLKDIPNIKFNNTNEYCYDCNIILQINNDVYVNTWIGMGYHLEDIGVPTLKSYYTLFTYIYNKLNINLEKMEYYVPDINYEIYDINNVKKFISENNRQKILIDNGEVRSYQSGNFNLNSIIDRISNEFPDKDFILTNSVNRVSEKPNVFYASEIIKTEGGDLNEISYFSTFCNMIIGRASGPYTYTVVKSNINDINKTYICICDLLFNAFWFLSINTMCNKIWINNYDEQFIYDIIKSKI